MGFFNFKIGRSLGNNCLCYLRQNVLGISPPPPAPDPCPEPCLTVTDFSQLPADNSECPSSLIISQIPDTTIDYFFWDGIQWAQFDVSTWDNNYAIGTLPFGWQVSFDEGLTWYEYDQLAAGITFDPVLNTEITLQYRNVENSCVYNGRTKDFECPVQCDTIYDLVNLPDPNTCDFVWYQPEGDPINHTYYYYTGGSWQPICEIGSVVQEDNLLTEATIDTLLTGWSVSFDGQATWIDATGTHALVDALVPCIVYYKSPNGCIYEGQILIYYTTAYVTDPGLTGFTGWTMNGGIIDFSDINASRVYWASVYVSADPLTNIVENNTAANNTSFRSLNFLGNTTPVDIDLRDGTNTPVPQTYVVLYPKAGELTFTTANPSLAVPLSTISFNKEGWGNYGSAPDFADAGMAAYLLAGRFTNVPSYADIIVTVAGGDVTVTLNYIFFYDPQGMEIDDDGVTITPLFTEIPLF